MSLNAADRENYTEIHLNWKALKDLDTTQQYEGVDYTIRLGNVAVPGVILFHMYDKAKSEERVHTEIYLPRRTVLTPPVPAAQIILGIIERGDFVSDFQDGPTLDEWQFSTGGFKILAVDAMVGSGIPGFEKK